MKYNINDIKNIYDSIKNAKNMAEKRAILHRWCISMDFVALLDHYSESKTLTNMIMDIQSEYESMIMVEKSVYKITEEELEAKIKKLKIVDEIYNSCQNPYIRLDKMLQLFLNPDVMQKSYALLIKFGKNDPKLDEIRPLLNNFDIYYNDFRKIFNSDIRETVLTAYRDNNEYYSDLYATFIVNEYIKDESSYLIDNWLKKYNISIDDFNYFVSIVKHKNKDLYNKFVVKKNKNTIIKVTYDKNMFDDLAYAIQNGEFVYGNKFDLLEFIKYLPLKNSKYFIEELIAFLNSHNLNAKKVILDYITKNHLDDKDGFKPIDIDSLLDAEISLNDKVISNSELRDLINYLLYREIPISMNSLKSVCRMYLNNEINLANIHTMNRTRNNSPIIIPNNGQKNAF